MEVILVVHYEVRQAPNATGRLTARFYDDPEPLVDCGRRGRVVKQKLQAKHGGKPVTILRMWFERGC